MAELKLLMSTIQNDAIKEMIRIINPNFAVYIVKHF